MEERTGLSLSESLQVWARIRRRLLPQALGSWGMEVNSCGSDRSGGVGRLPILHYEAEMPCSFS